MSKISKRQKAANLLHQYAYLLKCPLCHSHMLLRASSTLVCKQNHHSFDIARQGYVNVLTRAVKSQYSKKLFLARSDLLVNSDFFGPLTSALIDVIEVNMSPQIIANHPFIILDSGCGEGSHLTAVCEFLKKKTEQEILGVGIDLSKEGIMLASRKSDREMWLVADLANVPFMDQQVHVILNILSPANYAEFHRLLRDDGLVIKVVPRPKYLQELRQYFYAKDKQNPYSNVETVTHFKRHFSYVKQVSIQYTRIIEQDDLKSLVNMTPLLWTSSSDQVTKFLERESQEITIDLELLIGSMRSIAN